MKELIIYYWNVQLTSDQAGFEKSVSELIQEHSNASL